MSETNNNNNDVKYNVVFVDYLMSDMKYHYKKLYNNNVNIINHTYKYTKDIDIKQPYKYITQYIYLDNSINMCANKKYIYSNYKISEYVINDMIQEELCLIIE